MVSQSDTIPYAIALTLGASAVILFLLFGSVVIPIKAVIMTLLSITASFGALVFIFQEGNFSNVLGFTSPGFTVAGNPIIMFSVLFGLSMDYEVLLLSRIQEAYRRTGDNTASVAEGLAKTAGVITGAALIMVSVFAAFALADSITIKSIGVGMAIAVLIDATIVRVLLVPATMRLMGKLELVGAGATRAFRRPAGVQSRRRRATIRCARLGRAALFPVDPIDPGRRDVGIDRGADGREEGILAELVQQAVAAEPVLDRVLHLGETQLEPGRRRSPRSTRACPPQSYRIRDRLGRDDDPARRRGSRLDRLLDVLAERLGVREEEWRVPPE